MSRNPLKQHGHRRGSVEHKCRPYLRDLAPALHVPLPVVPHLRGRHPGGRVREHQVDHEPIDHQPVCARVEALRAPVHDRAETRAPSVGYVPPLPALPVVEIAHGVLAEPFVRASRAAEDEGTASRERPNGAQDVHGRWRERHHMLEGLILAEFQLLLHALGRDAPQRLGRGLVRIGPVDPLQVVPPRSAHHPWTLCRERQEARGEPRDRRGSRSVDVADELADVPEVDERGPAPLWRYGRERLPHVRGRIAIGRARAGRVAEDSLRALAQAVRRLDSAALLDLAQGAEQQRLVDVGDRKDAELREEVLLHARDDVTGVHRLPSGPLHLVPFARELLEGVRVAVATRETRPLGFETRVASGAQRDSRVVSQLARPLQRDLRIFAEDDAPLLAAEAVFVAPGLVTGGAHEQQQSAGVGQLVILVARGRLSDFHLGQHACPHSILRRAPSVPPGRVRFDDVG